MIAKKRPAFATVRVLLTSASCHRLVIIQFADIFCVDMVSFRLTHQKDKYVFNVPWNMSSQF